MPTLSRITIFPIKALDGFETQRVRALANGALENDRRWAIVDAQGRYVHGKRTPAIHRVRARFGQGLASVALRADGDESTFRWPEEAAGVEGWLSDTLGFRCRLIENADGGFPDDGAAPGPTLVSTASLAAAATWFPGVTLDEMRRRIRANLEIDAQEPFWEDRLADDGVSTQRFSVGGVLYRGRTICARCVVPTRDSQSGEVQLGFAPAFARRRKEQLPTWAPAEQFDHYYRLSINTSAEWIEPDASIRVGDEVRAAPSADQTKNTFNERAP